MTLSQYLIEYRTSHGLSQRAFSALCGLSNSYISLLEKNINPKTGGPIIPNLHSLNKISKAMGITIEELFASCDDMPVSIDMPIDASIRASSVEDDLRINIMRLIDSLPEADRQKALGYLQALADSHK